MENEYNFQGSWTTTLGNSWGAGGSNEQMGRPTMSPSISLYAFLSKANNPQSEKARDCCFRMPESVGP